MIEQDVKQLIAAGEDLHCEFKEARTALPENLFDTVCAFLNTDGGTILLGVSDTGQIAGVEADAVDRLKRDLANLSNNQQKVDPPFLLLGDGKVEDQVGENFGNRVGENVGERVGETLTENQQAILDFLKDEPTLSARDLSGLVGISVRKIETNIAHLREIGRLKRVGAARGGYWEVLEGEKQK